MRILRFDSADAAARALAMRVADLISLRPALVVGLPAGRTMIPVYQALTAICRERRIDTTRISTFQVDEYVSLADEAASFRAFLERRLLRDLGVDGARAHFLAGRAEPEDECARYE